MRVWSLNGVIWKQGEDRGAEAWWFDVTGPHGGLSELAKRFSLHPLAVEDCYSPLIHVPKIDDFGGHLFIVVQALSPGSTDDVFEELDVFLGPNFIITYTDHPLAELDDTMLSLRKGITARPGVDGIFHAVFDRGVDSILPAVNALSDKIDALQEVVVLAPGAESHTAILEMRAHAGRLRRVLTPQMEVAMRLSRGEYAVIQQANLIYYRDIYDHLARVDLALEAVREDADVALSTFLSAINNRMNEVMKVLSVVSALALPAVVITGIFGTNFDNVPGLHSNWGFTIMMGSMLAIGGALALFFRRRGWF
ncbi:MAG: magnesium transporter CorA family protein [Dehalococcoidia bacterium]